MTITATPVHLPTLLQVRELLTDLLGREVTLRPGAPVVPSKSNPVSIAVYVDDSLRVSAVATCDLPFSAYAGAAIGLLPKDTADESIESGDLSDMLAENLYEVLNIGASLFNVPNARHLKLYQLHPVGAQVPPDQLALALTLGQREDIDLEIAGYGKGRLSIVLMP